MHAQGNDADQLADANDGYENGLSFPEHRGPIKGTLSQYPDESISTPEWTSAEPTSWASIFLFQFTEYAAGSSQTDPAQRFLWSQDTFAANGGKLQQDINTVQSFAEDRKAPGESYQKDNLADSTKNFWDNLSRIARNTFDPRSTSGSPGIEDISICATSRNAMGKPIFECRREECHGKQFARHSELQRHEDRHNRPFMCTVASCNKKDFADRGSLQRHSREVHKSAKYFCPIPQCERHKRGFGRKYNLIGHNRRVHRGAVSNLLSPVSEDASTKSYTQEDDRAHQSTSDGEDGLGDEDDEELESQEDMASPPCASSKAEKFKQRLRKLRAKKTEHDRAGEQLSKDIITTERLLLDAVCNEN